MIKRALERFKVRFNLSAAEAVYWAGLSDFLIIMGLVIVEALPSTISPRGE